MIEFHGALHMFFSRVHATLHPALSVRRLVGWLVGPSVRHAQVDNGENAHFRPCPPVRNWWPCIRPCFSPGEWVCHVLLKIDIFWLMDKLS